MDIKIKIEDDTVLFDKMTPQRKPLVVRTLNSVGIYTIEDCINAKESDFPTRSRRWYWAMAHIFRNAYLGQDLVYDAIFDKTYLPNVGAMQCYKDLRSIGIEISTDYFISWVKSLEQDFTMEYVLRNYTKLGVRNYDLINYYLYYLEKKKDSKLIQSGNLSDLETLKVKLQVLISLDENLQKQISELQEKIAYFEKGSSQNGK